MNKLLTNFTEELQLNRPLSQNNTLFVIVHGADGSIAPFFPLANQLQVPVVAFGYEPSAVKNCETIEAFAQVYWQCLTKEFPNRSYVLAGYSYGGLVAYEMADLAKQETGKTIPTFMIDPNLPLAMRSYQADRLLELRVLASTVIPERLINQYNLNDYSEEDLFKLLQRCLKTERIEFILSARKHCLFALSKYSFKDRPEALYHAIHAEQKLGFDFIDEETKWIRSGTIVQGNHFTMLFPEYAETLANIIHSKIGN